MKFIVLLIFIWFSWLPPGLVAAESPVILILGDSLSAGYGMNREDSWVHLFEIRLQEKGFDYRILNSSISGDTSQGGIARLPRLLDKYQPRIVILELGANDGLRGIDPAVTRKNLSSMIVLSQHHNARVLLTGIKLPPNYGEVYTRQFESIYADLATEYHTLLVPFFMQGVISTPGLMQADGLHPDEEGQVVLLENVWNILQQALRHDSQSTVKQ